MTDTNYNAIAAEYKESKLQPWRANVESYTLLKLAGEVRDQAVLDLACGDGHYARLLRAAGAAVTGVDASAAMVELARAAEAQTPLGINYAVGDARQLRYENEFDVLLAAWLFNYARDENELAAMCKSVARALKPGGRLVGVNNDPNDAANNFDRSKYGFVKRAEYSGGGPTAGDKIIWTLRLTAGEEIEIINYYLQQAVVEKCMAAAGINLTWHQPQLAPAAQEKIKFWRPLLDHPPFVFFTGVKK